jgi:FkbM family methyltransferase
MEIIKLIKKEIIKLNKNLRNSKNFRGTYSEKISTFFTLTRLQIKRKLFKLFNSKNVTVNEYFLKYKFSGYDYSTIEFLFNEVFISNEYYFEPSTQEPFIIDCGANIGMSILYFKKLFPSSKIIAFEANPYAFKLLEENMKVNKIKNVELHNIALFDKETEISFYINDDIGTLVGSIKAERGGSNELKIDAQKLSNYLKNIETVDLIKMDVEGAEVNILSDLFDSSTIHKAKEYIIEYHHNMNDDKSILSSFLQKFELNGFSYNIKANFRFINSFQDILIHFYRK